MSHKHCIFCGEEIPVPRPTSWSSVCESPSNTMTPDTVGKRYHAFMISRDYKNFQARTATPVETASPHSIARETIRIMEEEDTCDPEENLLGGIMWAIRTACRELESQLTQVRSELSNVDEALARRPALADIKDRYAKVYKACEMAGRADKLELELTQVREELRQECSIKEAEKKILLAEIETSTSLRSELEKVKTTG